MYHPSTRLFTVLELLQNNGRMSGPELARRLEVSERTVRHYITLLRDLGIPVEAGRGKHGGYGLRPGYRLPPLMLDEDEALALVVGLLAARRLGLAAHAPAVGGLSSKVGRVMPEGLRRRVRALERSLDLDIRGGGDAPRGTVVMVLGEAVHAGRRVWMRYRSGRSGETEREVDPYGLVYRRGVWYVVGRDHLRGEVRMFRADRVLRAELRDERFATPAGFDALAHVEQALATIPGAWSVEALLETTLDEARARVPPTFGVIEETSEGVLFRGEVREERDLPWMAHFLAGLGCPLVVRRPPELREQLRRLASHVAGLAERTEPGQARPAVPEPHQEL